MTGSNYSPFWFQPNNNMDLDQIIKAKAYFEALEKDIKDKTIKDIEDKKKKEPRKTSVLKIWLTLAVLAVPTFIINGLLLLGGLHLMLKMARALGGL